jgi:oxygen-independent coproporphyrinogen-3 oxidase
VRTSVWSFTRPGIAPYSTVTHEDYLGFGAGAASNLGGVFCFNTFSVPDYVACAKPRAALVLQAGERLRRLHWFYWAIYRTRIESARYRALFGVDIRQDFGALLTVLCAAGLARRDANGWLLTEPGAIWVHRLQSLFSLSYIDTLWQHCQEHPWPQQVLLL